MLLIIDKKQADANTISDIFKYMGIVSYGTTPENASLEFSNRHSAILFINPELNEGTKALIKSFKTYSLCSSIFAVITPSDYNTESEKEILRLFDKTFDADISSSKIVCDIAEYQAEAKKSQIGVYRLAGIDASVSCSSAMYFDTPIPLTKTEVMILRFLISSHPIAKGSRDILKYSFRSGKAPESSSIRTHVSSINAKFMSTISKRMILSEPGVGYYISVNDG